MMDVIFCLSRSLIDYDHYFLLKQLSNENPKEFWVGVVVGCLSDVLGCLITPLVSTS